MRNRDSHRSIFLDFLLRVKKLINSDRRFGFCMKNCIYGQLEMSRILDFDPRIGNVQTLVPKNAKFLSYVSTVVPTIPYPDEKIPPHTVFGHNS